MTLGVAGSPGDAVTSIDTGDGSSPPTSTNAAVAELADAHALGVCGR